MFVSRVEEKEVKQCLKPKALTTEGTKEKSWTSIKFRGKEGTEKSQTKKNSACVKIAESCHRVSSPQAGESGQVYKGIFSRIDFLNPSRILFVSLPMSLF